MPHDASRRSVTWDINQEDFYYIPSYLLYITLKSSKNIRVSIFLAALLHVALVQ